MNHAPAHPPARLLIRGVNWLGDAVMTTPALMRLREHLPRAKISILTPAKLADAYADHPALDEVLAFESGSSLISVARRIRAGRYDAALAFPNSHRAALELLLGGVPVRCGFVRPFLPLLLTRPVNPRPGHARMRKLTAAEVQALLSGHANPPRQYGPESHQARDYLHLTAAAFGCDPGLLPPRLSVPDSEADDVARRFELPDNVPIIGVNPGAEYGPAKRWPAGSFLETLQMVRRQSKALFLIFGTRKDVALWEDMAGSLNAVHPGSAKNLAGKTSLRELMCLIKRCRVLLTNDSGPMHVAAALGVPVVVPFGSTSPELTGPLSDGTTRHTLLRAGVPCSPCFLRECPVDLRCLRRISSGAASAAISNLLR